MALLSACTFFLANNVIPVASREVYNLRANIANVKPAMAIAEGIFSNIGEEFSIKVNKKHGDNDQFLEKVLIHKKNPDGVNRTVINAERGELKNQEGKGKFLQLILEDGTYYEDIKTNTYASQQRLPFAKVHFNKYVINIDLSHLNNVDFNEKTDATTYRMMNVNQLSYAIDSLHTDFQQNIVDYGSSMFRRTGIFIAPPPPPYEKKTTATPTHITSVNQLVQMVDEHQKMFLFESAINYNKSQMDNVQFREEYVEYGYKILNLHIINLSDKFALTVACFVLFFVAAPLGAFIRKGGIGLPLVVAMVLFLSYHFIGMFMKNIAENNTSNPALAPWIPTLILLPLGIYLTHRVNTDKEMFHFPLSHKLMRYVEGKINNFKQKRQAHK